MAGRSICWNPGDTSLDAPAVEVIGGLAELFVSVRACTLGFRSGVTLLAAGVGIAGTRFRGPVGMMGDPVQGRPSELAFFVADGRLSEAVGLAIGESSAGSVIFVTARSTSTPDTDSAGVCSRLLGPPPLTLRGRSSNRSACFIGVESTEELSTLERCQSS